MSLDALFGTELLIIQAPMAGVQNSALTLAVSNAGGLESLPCAMLSPDVVRQELATIRAQTSRPFNLNFLPRNAGTRRGARESLARIVQELLCRVRDRLG